MNCEGGGGGELLIETGVRGCIGMAMPECIQGEGCMGLERGAQKGKGRLSNVQCGTWCGLCLERHGRGGEIQLLEEKESVECLCCGRCKSGSVVGG